MLEAEVKKQGSFALFWKLENLLLSERIIGFERLCRDGSREVARRAKKSFGKFG